MTRWKWWHEHRWEIAGVERVMVQQYQSPLYIRNWDGTAIPFGVPEPATLVLRRCSCGETTQIRMDGHWTLEQVKGA